MEIDQPKPDLGATLRAIASARAGGDAAPALHHAERLVRWVAERHPSLARARDARELRHGETEATLDSTVERPSSAAGSTRAVAPGTAAPESRSRNADHGPQVTRVKSGPLAGCEGCDGSLWVPCGCLSDPGPSGSVDEFDALMSGVSMGINDPKEI